jgi:hypothetical protein
VSIVTTCTVSVYCHNMYSQCLLSQHIQSVSIVTTCTVSVYCHNMYSQCLLSQHVQSVSIVTTCTVSVYCHKGYWFWLPNTTQFVEIFTYLTCPLTSRTHDSIYSVIKSCVKIVASKLWNMIHHYTA